MRVLVAGRNGQLAQALAEASLPDPQWQMITAGRPDLDLTDMESVKRAMDHHTPDIAINAAAYTAVDKAESEPEAAFALNETGAGNLASATAAAGVPLIHISTDYVFSGDGTRPWREGDPTGPVNVYGRSKLAGEKAVAAANPKHLILRTAWVHSPWGNNFTKTMLRLGAEREELGVVGDQSGTPSYAPDLAAAITTIAAKLAQGKAAPWGIYHLTNAGVATWYDFAGEIFRAAQRHGYKSPALKPITTADYPTPAARPRYSLLDNGKIGEAFGIRLRDWRRAVTDCVERLMAG
jgi:dTDP-4-dehydrorhamnose reductase